MTASTPSLGGPAGRPNVLLITTDEQRWSLPTPAGFHLPARDWLAERGTTFDRYYVASAMCSSSRSVMYTGRHVPITQIYDNDNMPYIRPLDPSLGTLGTMMRAAGYYTSYQGKWHLSNAYLSPTKQTSTVDELEPYGFSEFNDWGDIDGGAWAGLKIDPVIAGQAVKWLRDRAPVVGQDQPWFMAVNFVNPHDVMSYDYGSRRSIAPPPNLADAVTVRPPADTPIYNKVWDLELPATAGDDLSSAPQAVREYAGLASTMFGDISSPEQWRLGMNFYLNCIRDVDRSIALVLDALAASGQADRTVVVFTSDHGEMAGSHGLRQKGNLVYDENFHVPLVVVHPDVAGGGRSHALGSAVDLAPTILELAGVDPERLKSEFSGLHGQSLAPVLLDPEARTREGVLTAVESVLTLDADFWRAFGSGDAPARVQSGELRPDWRKRGFLRGWTDERYTFGRYFSPLEPNRPRGVDELLRDNDVVLYDRQSDPGETNNLASDPEHRGLVESLGAKLEALIDAEIGADEHAWVAERPILLGPPRWRGDSVGAVPAASA
ncbi:MAG TPA: sulfatase-like hydrolase/transferase [Humibacillus xanthopallidus]|nr:sulfatase-like hydrolase/transferase [Humibacillus xanthopallidus]